MLALRSHERKECPSGCASECASATRRVLQLVHVRRAVSWSIKTTMRRSGLPEGHSIARVAAHDCDCHLRRLTSRIGGWSDGKETTGRERSSRQESRRFCRRAVASLGSKFARHRHCGGPSSALSQLGKGVKRPDAKFLLKVLVGLRNEGRSEEQKHPTPESTPAIFFLVQLLLLPFHHHNPSTTTPPIC